MTTWRRIARAARENRARTRSATGELAAIVLVAGLIAAVGLRHVVVAVVPAIAIYVAGPGITERLRSRRADQPVRPSTAIAWHALTTHLVRAAAIAWLPAALLLLDGLGAVPRVAAALLAGVVAFELPRQMLPLLFGRTMRRRPRIRSILLDQANTLGDVVLSTACLQAVADSSPGMRVSYLCRESTAGLLQGHAAIDRVYTESTGTDAIESQTFSLSRLLRLRAIVEQARVDAVAVLWNRPTPIVPIATRLARVAIRCGFLDREGYGWMFNAGCARPADPTRHQAEHFLECLRSLDLHASAIPRLLVALEPQDVEHARRMLSKHGIAPDALLVALSPGTGGSNRSLPSDTHARFVQLIRTRFDAHTILLGSPDEGTLTARIAASSPPGTVDLCGLTTARQLAALISLARVHVGTDSGPGHVAAALGVPSVVIWPAKASKAFRWGPWMVPHVIVRQRASCPLVCVPWTCASDACVRVITADHLCSAFETVLNGGGVVEPRDGRRSWAAASLGVVVHAPDPDDQAVSALELLGWLTEARFVDVSLSCPATSELATRAAAAGFDVRDCDAANLADLIVEFDGGVIYDLAARSTLHLRAARLIARGWTRHPVYRVPARPGTRDAETLTDYLLASIGGPSREERLASASVADR